MVLDTYAEKIELKKNHLPISVQSFQDLEEIVRHLYLGEEHHYKIIFSRQYLVDIEGLFDRLIFECGLKEVTFTYKINEANSSSEFIIYSHEFPL